MSRLRPWLTLAALLALAHLPHVGMALWFFAMSTSYGAGLISAVPALVPLCGAGAPISTSSSLALTLAAVGVHGAARLLHTLRAGQC